MWRHKINIYADYKDIVIEKASAQPEEKKTTKQSPTPYEIESNLKATFLYNTC